MASVRYDQQPYQSAPSHEEEVFSMMHDNAEPVPSPMLSDAQAPLPALMIALQDVVTRMRMCTITPELDAEIVEGGMLLSDGHYELGWQRLGACMRELVAQAAGGAA